jgi:CubicO group peptidase (beta-lactamase class C family)
VASVTKSLVGGLAAAAAFDRHIVQADDRVGTYLSAAWRNADARRAQMRIRHLMSMSSGLLPYDNPRSSGYNTQFILNQPQQHAPGEVWSYASLPIDLLGLILQQETGQKLSAFLKTHVYSRIGVESFRLTSTLSDTEEAASHGLSITPRDAARIGYLLLHEGWWNNQQIISTENVEFLTLHPAYVDSARFEQTPGSPFVVPTTSPKHYAHTFWTNTDGTALGPAMSRDAHYGHGFGEDLVVTLPSLDMVVVRTGSQPTHTAAVGFRQEFMKRVMQAVIPR